MLASKEFTFVDCISDAKQGEFAADVNGVEAFPDAALAICDVRGTATISANTSDKESSRKVGIEVSCAFAVPFTTFGHERSEHIMLRLTL